MARIIVVTSGKGGVGKTTSSAAIASGLALKGKKTHRHPWIGPPLPTLRTTLRPQQLLCTKIKKALIRI